ncbi:uncharacterized protein LOC128164304 isoform X4 [Crassostrea angulata]|uniref:uncharacterized protein LOC128164304 isoform X4 n=1 Tax=Magallana angulata TaxID=2784310 RepID=UPI0022B1AD0A|nr:uncharacterized protein LOC128164304 isoform X4 [Crassostrea angulata]
MMVGIVRGKKPEVILNKLMNVKNFREKAVKVLSKCVKEECKLLCSKNNPLILGSTTEDIHSTDFLKIANELKEKAPVFSQMLKDTMNTTKPVGLVSSAAVILHHRNHNMSLIRHVVGQLLDYGGATDKTQTIDLLRCLGFSVGCSATHKKQVSLIDIEKKKTENTLLCQFIYQEFYKPSSSFEQGTLYHLRNVIHREDVTGKDEVVRAYRAHYAFVEDALDAFILGATMDVMGLNDLNGSPQQWNPSILSLYSNKKQLSWLRNLAETVINKHINLQGTTHLQDLVEEAAKLDSQNDMLHSMFDAAINQYICTCQKKYSKIGHFKRHLEKEHNWHFPTAAPKEPKKEDKVAVWRSSFMKAALILRDTCDAYEMGDGNRIFLNAKFEMLYANVAGHTKYQLWLWRMMAYEQAILTPKQAFEYKWNTTANLNGTIDGNIPNDTLVDICVQLVKKKIKEQDSNFTFDSAKNTALSCQIQDELRESNRHQVSITPFGKSRTKARKSSDINLMLTELMAGNIFKNIQGRQFKNFKNMKDVFEKVNLHKLYIWISKQKKRASYEMM